jgi:uncharacterized protein YndB with AHSA1/START domain
MIETRKTIDIKAPPSVVFRALTDESELVKWWLKEARMDTRVGGEYEFKFYWAEKNVKGEAKGKILELIPDKKISYTFASTNLAPGVKNSVVTWTLEELPDGKTRVTVVHSGVTWPGYEYFLKQLASRCSQLLVSKG